jgi:hypothetical protein
MAFKLIVALLVTFFTLALAAPADRARITSAAVLTAKLVPHQSECLSNTPAEICTKYVNGAETWMECASAYWDPGMGCPTSESTAIVEEPPATTEDAPAATEEPTATVEEPPASTEEPTTTWVDAPITETPVTTADPYTETSAVEPPATTVDTDGSYTETSAVETPATTVDTDGPLCSFYAFTEAECTEQMRAKRTAVNTLERLPKPISTDSVGNFSFSILPYTSSTLTNTLVFHTSRTFSTSVSDLETMPTVMARDEITWTNTWTAYDTWGSPTSTGTWTLVDIVDPVSTDVEGYSTTVNDLETMSMVTARDEIPWTMTWTEYDSNSSPTATRTATGADIADPIPTDMTDYYPLPTESVSEG